MSIMLRTPPGLCAINVDAELALYDPCTRNTWSGEALQDPVFRSILQLCAGWTARKRVEEALTGMLRPQSRIVELLDHLIEEGLLLAQEDPPSTEEIDSLSWSSNGWEAAYQYQRYCMQLPKLDYTRPTAHKNDIELMEAYIAEEQPPSNYKNYHEKDVISLPTNMPLRNAVEVLALPPASRRPEPMSRREVATLTRWCFGQTGTHELLVTGMHVRKTSPSGGSRHPTEAYVIPLDVSDLEAAVYHYNVEHDHLTVVHRPAPRQFVENHILVTRTWRELRPRLVYVLTTIPERSMFRYRESRSYRVLHHDVGHLLQNIRYVARGLDRQALCIYSMHEQDVTEYLALDGLKEAPIACALVW